MLFVVLVNHETLITKKIHLLLFENCIYKLDLGCIKNYNFHFHVQNINNEPERYFLNEIVFTFYYLHIG